MVHTCTYQIEVAGGVDQKMLNAGSPQQLQVVQSKLAATLLTAYCDQAALVGLIRYLHQQRYLILTIRREG